MSFRTYQAFLIGAAVLAAFLVALPIWDWWAYGRSVTDSPQVDIGTPYGSAPPPTPAAAPAPITGSIAMAAAMVAPEAQKTTNSQNVARAIPAVAPRSDRGAEPGHTAPVAVEPSERASRRSPPAAGRQTPPLDWGAVVSKVQGPSNASPLVWVRSLPIQVPLNPPPVERQAPAEEPIGTGEDTSEPTAGADEPAGTEGLRVSLLPSEPTVAMGRVVSVKVVLSGGAGITSVPFHLKFDAALLEFLGARTGSAFLSSSLQPLLLASVNPERPGDLAVGLALLGNSRPLNGSGSLVVIDFRAIGRGRTDLSFENSSVRGVTSEPLSAEFANTTLQIN